jgi:hypothetical protein
MSNAFNAYHYIALGCAAVVLFIITQYFSAFIAFVRSIFKRDASRKRAVERLQNLPRGEPLEPQPAVSTDLPLPVAAEVEPNPERAEPREVRPAISTEVPLPAAAAVEPILERGKWLEVQPAVSAEAPLPVSDEVQPILKRAEPLEAQSAVSPEVTLQISAKVQPIPEHAEPPYSGDSRLPLDSIVQQNIVDQLTDAVTGGPSEVQPDFTTEVSLLVAAEVEPILERAEPLKVQLAVNTEVPQTVRTKVQPIGARAKPQKIQPAVSTEVPLSVRAKARPIIERDEPLEPRPTQGELPLPVGSKVWAVCKFGSVAEGTPGIITGAADARFFWQSPTYLCTFADNRKARARPKDIEVYNHGHSLEELEQPHLKSILSRRMTLRAQQLRSRQRPTNLPFAGRTEVLHKLQK